MARTQETTETGSEQLSANESWARAAANCKYGLRNGVPYGGAEGFVIDLPCPGEWFAGVPSVQQRTEFQARAEYMLNRIAQPEAKKPNATRETVQDAVNKASLNGYEPTRVREKDPVEAEVERQFAAIVRAKVLAQAPAATDKQIERQIEKLAAREDGKAKLAELRAAILENNTYAVQRKRRENAADDLGIPDIDLN